jgi:hypothetical protein
MTSHGFLLDDEICGTTDCSKQHNSLPQLAAYRSALLCRCHNSTSFQKYSSRQRCRESLIPYWSSNIFVRAALLYAFLECRCAVRFEFAELLSYVCGLNGIERFIGNARPSCVWPCVAKENSWPCSLDRVLPFWVKVVANQKFE